MPFLLRSPLDLGAAIRDRRRVLGLSQQALADRVGVGRQWVVAIERGKERAELGLVLRTLRALDLKLLLDDGVESPSGADAPAFGAAELDALIERHRGPR